MKTEKYATLNDRLFVVCSELLQMAKPDQSNLRCIKNGSEQRTRVTLKIPVLMGRSHNTLKR